MNEQRENMEGILEYGIPGYHQVMLTPPVHLHFVSESLCALLGVSKEALSSPDEDCYLSFVHPADRAGYRDFLRKLSCGAGAMHMEYRLVRADGTVRYVRDQMTVRRTGDGAVLGDSVLTDLTDLRQESPALPNEGIPFGFLRYTCEKQPRVTEINAYMKELLHIPEGRAGEMDDFEMYRTNIFLMIPMEERRRFSKFLNRVYTEEAPIAGDMTLLRCDGTRARVFGWVSICRNEQGEEEFQSICMDMTDRWQVRKSSESRRYLQALSEVYEKIFAFDLDNNTIKCLHCNDSSYLKRFENIAMQTEEAVEKWLISSVEPMQQEAIRRFFRDFCQRKLVSEDGRPPQITYQARATDQTIRQYTGVFLKMDEAVSFYCCRETRDWDQAMALKMENTALREKMRDLVIQFSDGLAAFEVSPEGLVKPLYASENVCEFFGYTEEEWLPLTKRFTPLESFAAGSDATYEDFAALLRTGEAEFTYFDYKTETERKIRAICSEKEPSAHTSRYVLLYAVDGETAVGRKSLPEKCPVRIRTFGYFDVFVGEYPIAFRNKKSKELLALLVDRRGGYVRSDEAISFLWEDESVNSVTLSRYRKVALRLKNTLEEYGISDILESRDGKRRIVPERVECDLYRYLSGKEEYAQLFKGSYLTNYSWGETTLGELSGARE